MKSSKRFAPIVSIIVLAMIIGCDRNKEVASRQRDQQLGANEADPEVIAPPPADPAPTVSESVILPSDHRAAKLIAQRLNQGGTIRFDSQTGKAPGNDEPSLSMTLHVDGVVRLVFDNDEQDASVGEYAIDKECRLQIYFGPDDPWPPMPVSESKGALLIHPPSNRDVIQVMVDAGLDRADITEEDIGAAYEGWPLQCPLEPSSPESTN